VRETGIYWFTNDEGEKYLVRIPKRVFNVNTGEIIFESEFQAIMMKCGVRHIESVDSIGVGEFVGPLNMFYGRPSW